MSWKQHCIAAFEESIRGEERTCLAIREVLRDRHRYPGRHHRDWSRTVVRENISLLRHWRQRTIECRERLEVV